MQLFGKSKLTLLPAELEHARSEINIFRDNIKKALRFLREKNKRFFLRRPKAPLFMIIGADSAGKSSLLTHSGLGLIDAAKQNISNPNSTRYCHFWFAEREIFLDTAGHYTTASSIDNSVNLAWRGLIKMLYGYKRRCPLSGLIIAIDLPCLSQDKDKRQKILSNIKQRIYEISKYARELPVFVVFTKTDLISGFTDYFADLSSEERKQSFGVNFQDLQDGVLPIQVFDNKFSTLINSLHDRLVARLHKESCLEKRGLIKDFPLQIESLKSVIAEIINEIPSNSAIRLQGFFFTSSLQRGVPLDYLSPSFVVTFPEKSFIPLSPYAAATSDEGPYFSCDLFKNLTQGFRKKKNKVFLPKLKLSFFYFLFAFLFFTASFFLANFFLSFQHKTDFPLNGDFNFMLKEYKSLSNLCVKKKCDAQDFLELENKIKSVKIVRFKDARSASLQIQGFAKKYAPLFVFLKELKSDKRAVFIENESLKNLRNVDIKKLRKNLNAFSTYLRPLAKSEASDFIAFNMVRDMMAKGDISSEIKEIKSYADLQPEPLRSWLFLLTDNVMQSLFYSARMQLNQAWKEKVMPFYKENILARYPIFRESEQDINYEKFGDFFRQNGILHNFFNEYLSAFVDLSKPYWTWKSIGNFRLGIDQSKLENFIRADLIKKMFYAKGDSILNFGFTITKIAMQPLSRYFVLEIGDQKVEENLWRRGVAYHFVFKGLSQEKILMQFTDNLGKSSQVYFKGPWSLLKLFDNSSLQAIDDEKNYDLTLRLGRNAIRYSLVADDAINPLMSDVLTSFRCDENL